MSTSMQRGLVLTPPPGFNGVPTFDGGWHFQDGDIRPFLSYVEDDHAVNWSDELELLHEESSRSHFIDVWTRGAMLSRLGRLSAAPAIVDLGCSTGYLLEDLRDNYQGAVLVGVDLIGSGLRKAHVNVPDARLLQADLCQLPLGHESIDAIVSANVLEHVPDDRAALAEMHRVLRPGAPAILVVPAGPQIYDYYDRFLGHERRYGRGELAGKARRAGFEVIDDVHLGSLLYPMFWLVKKHNRARYDDLHGKDLEARVAADIERTHDSRAGHIACRAERALLGRGIRIPFGIRSLVAVRRPPDE